MLGLWSDDRLWYANEMTVGRDIQLLDGGWSAQSPNPGYSLGSFDFTPGVLTSLTSQEERRAGD